MERVVITCGIFDLCHEGHRNLIKKCQEEAGDGRVIAVVHDDTSCYKIKGKIPIQTLEKRMNNLKILGVDHVTKTTLTDPGETFRHIFDNHLGRKEWIFMRGDDNTDFPGKGMVDALGMETKFVTYTPKVSSTKLAEELWR